MNIARNLAMSFLVGSVQEASLVIVKWHFYGSRLEITQIVNCTSSWPYVEHL